MSRFQPVKQIPSPGRSPGIRDAEAPGENPKDSYGLAKVPLDIIPASSLIMKAVGLAVGDIKYGPLNWRKTKVQLRIYLGAMLRHTYALLDGQDIDPGTGAPHIAMIEACAAIISDAMYGGAGCVDNRPLPGLGGELMDEMNDFIKEMRILSQEKDSARSSTTSVPARRNKRVPSNTIRVPKRNRRSGLGY